MADPLDCILDLCRRLPPQRIEENIDSLVQLVPDLADDILSSIDQPLKVKQDTKAAKSYLICDYNRDGHSHRSPWSNEYDPPLADGTMPSPKIRKLEEAANEAFDVYREMYYEGGISSVYLWDLDDDGSFAGVVLLQKVESPSAPTADQKSDTSGSWDSIHVFEASERGRQAHYKVTSTVMLRLARNTESTGAMELSGSLTRQSESDATLDPTLPAAHISNIGRFIEEQELKMRASLQEVYLSKTRNICNDLRSLQGMAEKKKRQGLQNELVGMLRKS